MTHRLHRPTRSVTAFIRRMEKLNIDLARRGYQELCTEGMLDWNKTAVDNFLIRSTKDRGLLIDLLSFGSGHIWLLKEVGFTSHSHPLVRPLLTAPCLQYLRLNTPLREVFRVEDIQQELDTFLRKHRMSWDIPYPPRSGRFY